MHEARNDHEPPLVRLRHIAMQLGQLDVACYRRYGRDPFEALLGLGRPDARWCFFGRDPGEQEVRQGMPFVGPAGQKIRAVMAELGVSHDDVFWMNTVPFKPIGNKPWPLSVQRLCQPALLELLDGWRGKRVITFGEAAFRWFGIGQGRAARDRLVQFWRRPDKYSAELDISLAWASGNRSLTLCPLPHPSGANARWAKAFPDLLRARLAA